LDELEHPARSEPAHELLRQAARRPERDTEPERGVPEPPEAPAEEDDSGRALVDEHEGFPHHLQAVLGDDVDAGALLSELVCERARGQVMPFADACGQNQDARHGAELRRVTG